MDYFCEPSPEKSSTIECTTGPPMYECMDMVLKGDVRAEFLQKDNLVGSCMVANFTTVMAISVIKNYTRKGT